MLNKVKCHCGWTAGVCWDAKIKVSMFAKLVGQYWKLCRHIGF